MVTMLNDDDIRRALTPAGAVEAMRRALLAHAEGRLHAPPRAHTDLGDGRLVFTTGRLEGAWYGYRSYDSLDRPGQEQVVVLHDDLTGTVEAIAVTTELGPRRVGAIGAVAADALATATAGDLAVVGAGTQAWAQVWAISAVRDLRRVRVFSPRQSSREAFAARLRDELGLPAHAVARPEAAVDGADIVVLATSSAEPVIEARWLADGCYVTTLGPKQRGRAEFGPDLVDRTDVAVTDSRAQLTAYDPPHILAGTPQADRLVALGDVLAGCAPGRTGPREVALFCSVGLAGTEVALLARLVGSDARRI